MTDKRGGVEKVGTQRSPLEDSVRQARYAPPRGGKKHEHHVKETLIRGEYSHLMAVAFRNKRRPRSFAGRRAFTIQNGLFCKGYAVDQRLSIHCSRNLRVSMRALIN